MASLALSEDFHLHTAMSKNSDAIYKELTGFHMDSQVSDGKSVMVHRSLASRDAAARKIQKIWRRHRMSRTYKWMRYMLFRTERMLTRQVLKRLSPNEGALLADPALKTKVRFRLGGAKFPPKIMYKIYTTGLSVHYFNGHDGIGVGTQAAEDSFSVMGSRCYQEKIVFQDLQQDSYKVSKPYEVTDKMEYIQYMNTIDKKPAHLGGRNNDWRELKLTQSLIQGVIMDDRRQRAATRQNTAGNALEHAMELVDKYSKLTVRHVAAKKTAKPEPARLSVAQDGHVNLDDDFGMLFDWATHLDEEDLGDFAIRLD
ncbi:putative protein CXorf58 [Kappamyces sp. JEL0829]|nr:putative protein CXorf58 [Kappamyces sp. JEL0829]